MSKLPEKEGQNKEYLYEGLLVDIVLKQDQKTMTLTRGRIKDFLTSKPFHPRGLKVRLHKEGIQRLYDTSPKSKMKDVDYTAPYKDEDFIGRVQRVHYPENFGLLVVSKNGGQIDNNLYQLFLSIYPNNGLLLIDDSYNYNSGLENYLYSINEDIDIIIYPTAKSLFLNKLSQKIQHINKNIQPYLIENNTFINLNTGRMKLHKKLSHI